MITFENTGISSKINKSGRALVHTDIIRPTPFTGFTEDETYSGIVSGDTCSITINGILYSGTCENQMFDITIEDINYTGYTYTGYTQSNVLSPFPVYSDPVDKFDVTILGGEPYTGITNNVYKWTIYVPPSAKNLSEYLTQNADYFEQEILRKEALWETMPHTREVPNIFDLTGTTTMEIDKSEVVCPTIPDFVELAAEIGLNSSSMLMSLWDDDTYLKNRLTYYETKDTFTNPNVSLLSEAKTKKLTQIKKVAGDLLWNQFSKNVKDIDLSSNDLIRLRDEYKAELDEKIEIMQAEVNDLTTVDEVLNYKVGFNITKILYNKILNKFYGEARATYHLLNLTSEENIPLSVDVIELELVEDSKPYYDPATQKLISSRVVDVENKQWILTWEIVDKTAYEIAMDDWDSNGHVLRIIAPQQLIMDDIGIKMYGWFQLNGLPIVKKGDYVRLYCNEILPEHQAVVNALQGVIIVENMPTES